MSWSVEQQKRFSKLVPQSHEEGRERATKLIADACLAGRISENTHFLIIDALAEAFRAGASAAIFGDENV